MPWHMTFVTSGSILSKTPLYQLQTTAHSRTRLILFRSPASKLFICLYSSIIYEFIQYIVVYTQCGDKINHSCPDIQRAKLRAQLASARSIVLCFAWSRPTTSHIKLQATSSRTSHRHQQTTHYTSSEQFSHYVPAAQCASTSCPRAHTHTRSDHSFTESVGGVSESRDQTKSTPARVLNKIQRTHTHTHPKCRRCPSTMW